jgi:hypothetical protein
MIEAVLRRARELADETGDEGAPARDEAVPARDDGAGGGARRAKPAGT